LRYSAESTEAPMAGDHLQQLDRCDLEIVVRDVVDFDQPAIRGSLADQRLCSCEGL
jgi:hypothetical protein